MPVIGQHVGRGRRPRRRRGRPGRQRRPRRRRGRLRHPPLPGRRRGPGRPPRLPGPHHPLRPSGHRCPRRGGTTAVAVAARTPDRSDGQPGGGPAGGRPRHRAGPAGPRRAPRAAGGRGTRRYLVLVGTPAEGRDLGGHIGHYAELEADDGRITLTETGPIIDLWTAPGADGRRLLDPSSYPASFIDNRPQNFPQNWGATPDLPTAARAAAELYPQSGGQPIDGVAYIDPVRHRRAAGDHRPRHRARVPGRALRRQRGAVPDRRPVHLAGRRPGLSRPDQPAGRGVRAAHHHRPAGAGTAQPDPGSGHPGRQPPVLVVRRERRTVAGSGRPLRPPARGRTGTGLPLGAHQQRQPQQDRHLPAARHHPRRAVEPRHRPPGRRHHHRALQHGTRLRRARRRLRERTRPADRAPTAPSCRCSRR